MVNQFSHIEAQSQLRCIGVKTSQTSVFSTPHVLQLLTSTDTVLSDHVKVDRLPSFAFRTALSAWRPWPGRQATKDLVLEGSPGPSQWAAWCSVVISTTSSALSLCTTMATRMAACSAPHARPSTESRLATSPQEKWSIMSSLTRYQVTLTAKPSGSFIISLRASRYSLAHLYMTLVCKWTKDVCLFGWANEFCSCCLGPRAPKSRQTLHCPWVPQTLLPPWQRERTQGKELFPWNSINLKKPGCLEAHLCSMLEKEPSICTLGLFLLYFCTFHESLLQPLKVVWANKTEQRGIFWVNDMILPQRGNRYNSCAEIR